jgi:hypothetical protein
VLDVAALCQMFEAAEDASQAARQNSERDRDYVDGVQYTAEELAAFKKRKQPPIIINRVKRKVDFLKGYEMSQRVDPKALPRTPAHEEDAAAAEQALRYIADQQRFDHKRSRVWDNLLVEGAAGYRVAVKDGYDGPEIEIQNIPWDRMFWDPHSAEPDFSDAGYLGLVRWLDFDEALAEYPDKREDLEWTISSTSVSDTYDDRPKFQVWADKTRKRVRICQIWFKKQGAWYWAEFTKGGILAAGQSPYVTDKGESDCELIFGSAYVNRENERYGLVREMISPQDEINKRRSKSLHLLNTTQLVMEHGAVEDVEAIRREAARPDGVIVVNPGHSEKFRMETRLDLSQGHQLLMNEAKTEIDMMAGNVALQGNAAEKAASGKAIIASQQGGAMEIAPIMDSLRDMDIRVYRAAWARVRQFWTGEKWIRITDDERNVKWVALNVDPRQIQMMAMQNPQMAEKISGVVQSVAELDCDIIIDDGPDGITPQLEQFQSLVELKKMDANGELPFRAIVEAMPNLRNKKRVLDAMDQAHQQAPEQAAAMQLQLAGAQAKVQLDQAGAQLKQAQAVKAMQEAHMAPMQGEQGQMPEPGMEPVEQMEVQARIQDILAAADKKRMETAKIDQEIQLAPIQLKQQAEQAKVRAANGAAGR